jgi:putative transposase
MMEAEFNHLNHATWVAQIIGYMKRKSSIWIAQNVEGKMRNFLGHKFWARGYFVTTVGRDEEVIRAYIQNQELADRELEQLELKISAIQKSKQTS